MTVLSKEMDQFPVVLATVQLADDERRAIRRGWQLSAVRRQMLAELFNALAEDRVDQHQEYWDQLAAKAGYANLAAVDAADRQLTYNHLSGTLTVRGRDGDAGKVLDQP